MAEQAAIIAVDAAYVPAARNAKVVAYAQLVNVPVPGMQGAGVPGVLMDRLPEFLCQLGGKKRQADYR